MSKKSSSTIWPYAIAGSIILVFGFCVATVMVSMKLPVEKSDTYMMNYHEADASANDLIKARIAFDKNYKIEYISDALNTQNATIKYRVVDVKGKPVEDAELLVVVTRPNNHKYDQELTDPKVNDGIYVFENVQLPKEGRWDIMAKVNIGEQSRFYNVKADTRYSEAFEY